MVGALVGIIAGWACIGLSAAVLHGAGVTGDPLLWASLGCGVLLYLVGASLVWLRLGKP
jgi:hypothetical protein